MADPAVIHQDLELFLIGWYRAALAARPEPVCQGVTVARAEPSTGTFPPKLLVIRDDGGTATSLVTAEHSIGMTVLAGTKENPKVAKDLARIVYALRVTIPSGDPSNPVAAIGDSTSPVDVAESQPRSRQYMTTTMSVVGTAL